MSPTTLFINAGGQSRRMGQSKALLPTPQGMPLIRLVAERLHSLTDDVLVVANDPNIHAATVGWATRCLSDAYPNSGPLGGLATALDQVEGWLICVGCDMPFLDADLFAWLLTLTEEVDDRGVACWDALVPHTMGRPQPLHAIYHPRCLPAIRARLTSGQRRMDSFFDDVRTHFVDEDAIRRIDPELTSFVNVNTADEWQAAQKKLR